MEDKNSKWSDAYIHIRPSFKASDQAFVRVPLLPVEALCTASDKKKIVKSNSLIHEAIYIASAELIDSLSRSSNTTSIRKVHQLERSLLRYVIRMCSRTTPFGLFSGIAQVSIGKRTQMPFGPLAAQRHRTRMDMDWLLTYVNILEHDHQIQTELMYVYQPILVRIGNRYHFEHKDAAGKMISTSVVATSGLQYLIAYTRRGEKYGILLRKMLAAIPEAKPAEMNDFLEKFIKYGVIRSSLHPPLTHGDPLQYVLGQLVQVPNMVAQEQVSKLRALFASLQRYDALPPGSGEDVLRRITGDVVKDFPVPKEQAGFTIDLALHFTETPMLQKTLADDAIRLAELLLKLSPSGPKENTLSAYRQIFTDRYGSDRLMPILEVLDAEKGLGLPAHYKKQHSHIRGEASVPSYDALLQKLAVEALQEKRHTIELTQQTIAQLTNSKVKNAKLPYSLEIAAQISAVSEDQVNQNNYLFVSSPMVGSQAAGRSVGRFADMLGDKTIQYLDATARLQEEGEKNVLFAELVYMPTEAHTANVAIRPGVRKYEIVFGVNPGVKKEHVIALDDLYVGIRDKHFYLWSAKYDKEVRIVYAHMLTPRNAPPLCRFLIEASRDDEYSLKQFSWGAAASLPMLPRVQYGRLVLALAEWKMQPNDIFDTDMLRRKQYTTAEEAKIYTMFHAWRKKWRVPRHVYLIDNDNRLLLDLQKKEHIMEIFYSATGKGGVRTIRLREALPGPADAWIHGSEGHYINECIFQLTYEKKTALRDSSTILQPSSVYAVAKKQRTYFPGSEWLFCKFYIPVSQQNECLSSHIKHLCMVIEQERAASEWFFVRYRDPDSHLRVRFRSSLEKMSSTLLPLVFDWARSMQEKDLLQKFTVDSYEREVERYGGGEGLDVAEKIFCLESGMDLQLIDLKEKGCLPDSNPAIIAALTTNILLSSLGLDDGQQISWAKTRRMQHELFVQDYRRDRTNMLRILQDYKSGAPRMQQFRDICEPVRQGMVMYGTRYRRLEAAGQLGVPLERILSSLVHMHSNRLIGIDRTQEQRALAYLARGLTDLPKWQQGRSQMI